MKNLRLLMPQWQGGNNKNYYLGAQILAFLAPKAKDAFEIQVPIDTDNDNLKVNNKVVAQDILLKQLDQTTDIINKYKPDHIVTLGGDCLVSQAPFAYLNKRYNNKLGVLFLDAHPDISNPNMFEHEHAMVLANLLGIGDPKFSNLVEQKLDSKLVLYAGLEEMTTEEKEIVTKHDLKIVTTKELVNNSDIILNWIKEKNIEHLAIHFDLDVIDPLSFRSLLFANPNNEVIEAAKGTMSFNTASRILTDVSNNVEVVGLTIAEHLPWDDINLHDFLSNIPILKE
ncbi:arginase family protein [Mycoplasma sp. P36-A1]|uniref:arginase family protein n=1 Tax=Mycoplasma sp. P36-A1 TaxID=3252900 RepID=UPI003C2DDD05